MGQITWQKSRKEYKCSKCGTSISKGDDYKRIIINFKKPRIVCDRCKIKRSELTDSEYLQWLYDLQDDCDCENDIDKDYLISELEGKKEELDDKLSNMPESLQDSSSSGMQLSERIESIDNAISTIEETDVSQIFQYLESTDSKYTEVNIEYYVQNLREFLNNNNFRIDIDEEEIRKDLYNEDWEYSETDAKNILVEKVISIFKNLYSDTSIDAVSLLDNDKTYIPKFILENVYKEPVLVQLIEIVLADKINEVEDNFNDEINEIIDAIMEIAE